MNEINLLTLTELYSAMDQARDAFYRYLRYGDYPDTFTEFVNKHKNDAPHTLPYELFRSILLFKFDKIDNGTCYMLYHRGI